MNQAQLERSLKPSQAHALDVVRNNAGINNFTAHTLIGRTCLTQRVSELGVMGFQFAKERRAYIDGHGEIHKGVVHYTLLGWSDPRKKREGAA